MPRRCALGCNSTGKGLHVLPLNKSSREILDVWLKILNCQDKSIDELQKLRVCDLHFTEKDRNRCHRLNALAVPSLFLSGTTEEHEADKSEKSDTPVTKETVVKSCQVHLNNHNQTFNGTEINENDNQTGDPLEINENDYQTPNSLEATPSKKFPLIKVKVFETQQVNLLKSNKISNPSLLKQNTGLPVIKVSNLVPLQLNTGDDKQKFNLAKVKDHEVSSITKECKVSLKKLPQILTDSKTNDGKRGTRGKHITTVEAPNKIYKVVSINNKIMLVEQKEHEADLDDFSGDNSSLDEDYDPRNEPNISDTDSDITNVHENTNDTTQIRDKQKKTLETYTLKTNENYNNNNNYKSPKKNCDFDKSGLISKKPFPIQYKSDNPFTSNTDKVHSVVQDNTAYKNPYPGVYIEQHQNDDAIENQDISRAKAGIFEKKRSPEFTRVIEDFVNHFADIMNYEWYNDQDILIYGKHGTAMVLLHEAKYRALKKIGQEKDYIEKLLEKNMAEHQVLQMEHNKVQEVLKVVQEHLGKVKEELKKVKNQLTVAYTKEYYPLKVLYDDAKSELTELRSMKEILLKLYNDPQVNILMNGKKKKLPWPEDDIKKIIFLTNSISRKTYQFLKNQLKFPLPHLDQVLKWMAERNIHDKTKKMNKKTKNPVDANKSDIQKPYLQYQLKTELKNEEMHDAGTTEHIQDPAKPILQDVETQKAIEMIVDQPQVEVVINGVNDEDVTRPVYTDGDICLTYMDDSNVHEEYYIIDESYVKNDDGNFVAGEIIYTQGSIDINEKNANVEDENIIQDSHNADAENYEYIDNNDENNGHNIDAENHHMEINTQNNDRAHNEDDSNVRYVQPGKYSKWDLNAIQKYCQRRSNLYVRYNWKLTCQLCMKQFQNTDELKQHIPLHYFNTYCTSYLDAQSPFICEFCQEKLPHRHALIRHHLNHLNITEFRCWRRGCSYVGKNKACLLSHADSHRPRQHPCPTCPAAFKDRKSLRKHYARRHSTRGNYRCHLCQAYCYSEYTFHRHMVSHNKPPKYKCTVEGCTEAFYSAKALSIHKLSHSGGEFKCPHCPIASFTQKFHLKRHLERHENEQLSKCNKCDKIFDSYTEYYYHLKMEPHPRKMNTCICKQTFETRVQLQAHKKECPFVSKENKKKRQRIVQKHRLNAIAKKEEEHNDLELVSVQQGSRLDANQKVIITSQKIWRPKKMIKDAGQIDKVPDNSDGIGTNSTVSDVFGINSTVPKKQYQRKSVNQSQIVSHKECIKKSEVPSTAIRTDQESTQQDDALNKANGCEIAVSEKKTINLEQINRELTDNTNNNEKNFNTSMLKLKSEGSIPQQQQITLKLYPVSKEQRQMLEAMTKLKKLVPTPVGKKLKLLKPVENIRIERLIHRENNEDKEEITTHNTIEQVIPIDDDNESNAKEQNVIGISDDSCQQTINVNRENAQQEKIIDPMIKYNKDIPATDDDIPQENIVFAKKTKPKVITVSKKNIFKKLVVGEFGNIMTVSPLNFNQNTESVPIVVHNVNVHQNSQTGRKIEDNVRRSTLVTQMPEYSQHVESWQDRRQGQNVVVPDTGTQPDMPHID